MSSALELDHAATNVYLTISAAHLVWLWVSIQVDLIAIENMNNFHRLLTAITLCIMLLSSAVQAQEIQPEPELPGEQSIANLGPMLINSKAGQVRRYAYYSLRKSIMDELDFSPKIRSQLNGEYYKFNNLIKTTSKTSQEDFKKLKSPTREDVELHIEKLKVATRSYFEKIEQLIGTEKFVQLKSLMQGQHLAEQGLAVILLNELRGELMLDEEQARKIREIELAAREKIQAEMARIRENAHHSMLESLSSNQRDVVKKYFQDHFDWDAYLATEQNK